MFDEPMANSSMFALPRNTAPSRSRLAPTVLSYGGMNGSRMRRHALGAEQVLDRQRNAGERRELTTSQRGIGGIRLGQRTVAGHRDECVQMRVQRHDRGEVRLGQLARAELP